MTSSTEPELRPEPPVPPAPSSAPDSLAVHDRGTGYPVVFLHGQPGGAEIWEPVQRLLEGSAVRTLALDRPGYGATSVAAGGFRHNAEVLTEVLSRLGGPAIVVAHSWAAGPALLATERARGRVSGLVLCAPVGDPGSVTVLDRALARGPVGRFVLRTALAIGGWLVHRPGGERLLDLVGLGHLPRAEARSATQAALDRRARQAAAVEQMALVEELVEVRAAARDVRVPTIVLGGERDGIVRPQAVRGLARSIPGARLLMLPGGHLLPVEHASAVAAAVLDLVGLAGIEGSARRAGRHPFAQRPAPRGRSSQRRFLRD